MVSFNRAQDTFCWKHRTNLAGVYALGNVRWQHRPSFRCCLRECSRVDISRSSKIRSLRSRRFKSRSLLGASRQSRARQFFNRRFSRRSSPGLRTPVKYHIFIIFIIVSRVQFLRLFFTGRSYFLEIRSTIQIALCSAPIWDIPSVYAEIEIWEKLLSKKLLSFIPLGLG